MSNAIHLRPGLTPSADHRALWWALGIGTLLRLLVLVVFAPWDPATQAQVVLFGDANDYDTLAKCMLQTGGFCDHTARTPGYPAFLAATYAVAGMRPWIVLFLQVVVDGLSVALAYSLGMRYFSRTTAAAAAWLLALDPITLFMSSNLGTDNLFTLLFISSVASFLRGLATRRLTWIAGAGLLLGLATWIRPSGQYLALLFCAAALWRLGLPMASRLAAGVALMAAFLLAIAPWLYRNYDRFDAISMSTVKGATLMEFQVALAMAWSSGIPLEEIRQRLDAEVQRHNEKGTDNPFEIDSIKQQVALAHIRSQPIDFAKATLRGMIFMYLNVGTERAAQKLRLDAPTSSRPISSERSLSAMFARAVREKGPQRLVLGATFSIIQFAQYLLASIGAWLAWRDPRYRWTVGFFVVLIAYFTLTSGASAEARYKMPVTPLYLLLAGLAIQAWRDRRLGSAD